jgi:hypothetical protein
MLQIPQKCTRKQSTHTIVEGGREVGYECYGSCHHGLTSAFVAKLQTGEITQLIVLSNGRKTALEDKRTKFVFNVERHERSNNEIENRRERGKKGTLCYVWILRDSTRELHCYFRRLTTVCCTRSGVQCI